MKKDDVYKFFPNIKVRHEMSNKLIRSFLTKGSNTAREPTMNDIYLFYVICKSYLLLDLNKNIAYGIFYNEPNQYVMKSDIKIINENKYVMNFDDLEVHAEMSIDASRLIVYFIIRQDNFAEKTKYKQTESILVLEDEYIKDIKIMKEILQTYPNYKIIHRTANSFWY